MLKTKTTIVTKVITFILSMLILFYAVPSVVYSETIDALSRLGEDGNSAAADAVSSAELKLPLYEVEELREENVKHYKLSDGTYKAVVYSSPVHYKEAGEWKEIDNSIKTVSNDKNAKYTAEIADVEFSFPDDLTENDKIKIKKDGKEISFGYILFFGRVDKA